MAKKKKCPACEGGEKWAVPFADFFSLLLALFIALYAIASQNKDRMKALSKSFAEIFDFTPAQMNMIPQDAGKDQATSTQASDSKDSKQSTSQTTQQQIEIAKQLMKDLQAIKDVAPESGNGSDTEVVMTDEGIRVRMLNSIIFDNGSAQLTPASKKVVDILAASIKNYPGDIKVEGHTSSTPPPKGSIYPSNWELSSARASAVVREFISLGFNPKKFTAVGYADTKPTSKEPESSSHFLNQRVDIVLMRYDGKGEVGGTSSILDNPPPQTSIR